MQKNIKLRHSVINFVREFMNSEGFMELATPILTAPSPEGARDYLVPSRIHKGSFMLYLKLLNSSNNYI